MAVTVREAACGKPADSRFLTDFLSADLSVFFRTNREELHQGKYLLSAGHEDCVSIGTLRAIPMREEITVNQRKRDSMVAYLRRRMAEFGIGVEDVAAAIAQDQIRRKSARYRSATGQAWSGDGEMPQWLKQAISAGQSLEHFAVDGPASQPESALCRNTDWREDPFAGTRLATVDPAYGHAR